MNNCLKTTTFLLIFLAHSGLAAIQPGQAQTGPSVAGEKSAPYDDRLMRLSEILGSVHYLRNLCKAEQNGDVEKWRDLTKQLIDIEAAKEPKRRSQLTAAFNHGYRSFASVYTSCTQQAIVAEQKYRAEGATLAVEIAARFGN